MADAEHMVYESRYAAKIRAQAAAMEGKSPEDDDEDNGPDDAPESDEPAPTLDPIEFSVN